ncbi:MAG: hypothetical protein SOT76_10275, partial [Eubacteriales bacterium]|nr:hypothetical protein [Eubacteriales bacterium]
KDFSGAETARKRFFLWKMGFSGAKIAPCPRCIFALPFLWKSGSKWSRALPGRKGCGPLELSGGFLTVWSQSGITRLAFPRPSGSFPEGRGSGRRCRPESGLARREMMW